MDKDLAMRVAEIEKADCELEKYINDLDKMFWEADTKNCGKDAFLIQQIRLAAMGEVIGNIAHQWRQPLNSVGIIIQDVQECYEYGELTTEYLKNSVRRAMELIAHMSQTINDFGNFSRPEKMVMPFSASEAICQVLTFLSGSFDIHGICVHLETETDVVVNGSKSEYAQVVLSILNNSMEALVERRVVNAGITIHVSGREGKSLVIIADNGGGIPDGIIEKIFDPYFSASGAGGAGLGLYMAKAIIERNMKGRLTVRNSNKGAEFLIEV